MEKLNLAKLLKDCPTGMELDSTLFEGLEFDCIVDNECLPIRCRIKHPDGGYTVYNFTKYGCWLDTTFAKCVIFPKGKTTWKGFQRPFRDGDVIYNQCIKATAIFYKQTNDHTISHCFLNKLKELKINHYHSKSLFDWRLATEEEKERLFDAIKANGYKWNAETKTLEKLGKEKFDITTLKPFESRVLVRTSNKWVAAFYSHYDKEAHLHYCVVGGLWYKQCIPYESNEHLLDTTDDCDEYYKTWE